MKAQQYTEKQIDSINLIAQNTLDENPDKAFAIATKAYQYSDKIQYDLGKLVSLEFMGYVYYMKEDSKKVLEYSIKQEKLALEVKDYKYVCIAMRSKAGAYAALGFYDEAEMTLRNALVYVEKISKPNRYHRIRGAIFETFDYVEGCKVQPDYSVKLKWSKKVLEEYLKIENAEPLTLTLSYSNLGKAYISLGKYDSATVYLNKALQLSQKYDDKFVEPQVWFGLARVSQENKNYKEAISFFKKSYEKGSGVNSPTDKRDIYEQLFRCYSDLGDSANADLYYKKWNTIKDSITNAERNSINTTTKQIVKEKEEKLTAEKNNLYYIIIGSVLLLIISIYFIIKYIKNYQKEKLQKEKTEANLIKNEGELSELELKINDSFNEVLELAKNNNPAFLIRFKEVYPEFSSKLLSAYPEMTLGQLKFCALLKLNFSTKEIAEYSHLSVRSVEMKKSRLRKQLNISSHIDLNKWMMEF